MKSILSTFFLVIPAMCLCGAAQASTVALTASPNPSTFGQPLTLTASVAPSNATGKVTFYQGAQVLGLAPVTGGVATLVSRQVSAGHTALTARYDGGGGNTQALSAPFVATVNTPPGAGFPQATPYSAGSNPCCVVTADFNADGKLDTAVISGPSQAVYVYLGNGNGTFQGVRPIQPGPARYRSGSVTLTAMASRTWWWRMPTLATRNRAPAPGLTS